MKDSKQLQKTCQASKTNSKSSKIAAFLRLYDTWVHLEGGKNIHNTALAKDLCVELQMSGAMDSHLGGGCYQVLKLL